MKTPGMFGETKVLTTEERLDESDRKLSAILARIQTYDKVLTEFDSVKASLASVRSSHEELKTSLAQSKEYITASHLFAMKSAGEAKSASDKLSSQIGILSDSIASVQNKTTLDAQSLHAHIEGVDAKYSNLSEGFLDTSDLQSLKKAHQQAVLDIHNKIDAVIGKVRNIAMDQSELKDKHSAIDEAQSASSGQIQVVRSSLSDHVQSAEYSMKSLKSYVDTLCDRLKDQTVSYMDSVKIEMLGSPSSMESVRKEILNKLNLTSMDGTNAVMKVANNEQAIKLLEKKVENLAILLKRNEITKMV
jgi:hypothetical protein